MASAIPGGRKKNANLSDPNPRVTRGTIASAGRRGCFSFFIRAESPDRLGKPELRATEYDAYYRRRPGPQNVVPSMAKARIPRTLLRLDFPGSVSHLSLTGRRKIPSWPTQPAPNLENLPATLPPLPVAWRNVTMVIDETTSSVSFPGQFECCCTTTAQAEASRSWTSTHRARAALTSSSPRFFPRDVSRCGSVPRLTPTNTNCALGWQNSGA